MLQKVKSTREFMGRALKRSQGPLAGPWSLHVLLSGSVSTMKRPVFTHCSQLLEVHTVEHFHSC